MGTSVLKNIMDSGTTGDGDSLSVTVGPVSLFSPTERSDRARGGPAEKLYDIAFSAQYASGSGTLTPYFCNDPGSSPQAWEQIKKMQDDGTDVAITRTDSFNMVLSLPSQSAVKWTLSSSSSPDINMTARGVLR